MERELVMWCEGWSWDRDGRGLGFCGLKLITVYREAAF
jgi:hypothetical protein